MAAAPATKVTRPREAARTSGLLLGAIADDFTGATDLANNLVRHGMRTVQTIGVPEAPPPDGTEAIVVALKSRTARTSSTSSTARRSTVRRRATSAP
jgi:uncharacterized protein YgbK (DUF1537 family)